MRNRLTIVVGLPGSGKTTFAKRMRDLIPEHIVYFEADMYFEDVNGKYNFDRWKLGDAHQWCYQQVEQALVDGKWVYVSNTNLSRWERKKYIDLANQIGCDVGMVVCNGTYQNIHGVPEGNIESMRERYEAPSADEFEGFKHDWTISNVGGGLR